MKRPPQTAILVAVCLTLLLYACAPQTPPATPTPRAEEPPDVVRAFLEAQRTGNASDAAARWGFATDAFTSVAGPQDETALREEFRRKGEDGLPKQYTIGATETPPPPHGPSRVFVQVWLDRPQQGPPSLYELVRTPDGWKIVSFLPAPTPPLQTP